MTTALVVGVGHPFRHDDGVGPLVAEKVAALGLTAVEVLVHHGEGTDLMARWAGFDRVVLVDATCSGQAAGRVRHWDDPQALPTACFAKSSHVFGVAEAVEMAGLLGKAPPSLRIIGIEGSDFSAGQGLSLAVAAAVEEAVGLVVAFVDC
mgnify:CR=1 FL=1